MAQSCRARRRARLCLRRCRAAAIDATAPAGKRGAITAALYEAFYLGAGSPAVVGLVTLGHPLASTTSWVTAAAARLVLPVGAAARFVR
ncbi:hypothetical protein [Saccharopolyspora pogona]|uniref:hypothetical protein n=1 Tax=Saccharopolyspora pogona TaxID=333966 RepID=UPI001CC23291|nr:hypothetical protein [Saccharopolyspora pogona]